MAATYDLTGRTGNFPELAAAVEERLEKMQLVGKAGAAEKLCHAFLGQIDSKQSIISKSGWVKADHKVVPAKTLSLISAAQMAQ